MDYHQILVLLTGKEIKSMALKFRTDVSTASQIIVQSKNTGLTITDGTGKIYSTTSAGEITFPLLTTDDVDYITHELPLSQFGEIYNPPALNITSVSTDLKFNRVIPLFMGGNLHQVQTQTIPIPPTATGTKTYYVYVKLVLGTPAYYVYPSEQQESDVSMFIGTVVVGTGTITAINVNTVSRFSIYRPSVIQKGAAFPVSTGNPTQTGTINW